MIAEAPGGPLDRHEHDELYELALTEGLEHGFALLSGPHDDRIVPAALYRRLTADLVANGCTVAVDLAGDRLAAALAGQAVPGQGQPRGAAGGRSRRQRRAGRPDHGHALAAQGRRRHGRGVPGRRTGAGPGRRRRPGRARTGAGADRAQGRRRLDDRRHGGHAGPRRAGRWTRCAPGRPAARSTWCAAGWAPATRTPWPRSPSGWSWCSWTSAAASCPDGGTVPAGHAGRPGRRRQASSNRMPTFMVTW